MSDLMSDAPVYPVLAHPAEGIPDVIDSPASMAAGRQALQAGTGPLALDTERAHGFRYTAKAYLIQIRREGGGTHLIDPLAFEAGAQRADLAEFADEFAQIEWILHAATQDLPCLAEVNLLPRRLFDTELAARLLGLPKVNLSALMEQALGICLLKEHSAADWSRRPLPPEWLSYAALDVEHLTDLREWLIERLSEAGKLEWAQQEFAHLVEHARDVPAPRTDPWRRTSGLHSVRTPAGLAVVRELWQARDEIAARCDRAPGRILPDRAISELAAKADSPQVHHLGRGDLRRVRAFGMRQAARYEANWLAALDRAAALPRDQLPPRHVTPEGPPPPRTWESRWPESFARWNRVRPALEELARSLDLPVENLLTPDTQRRLLWESEPTTSASDLDRRLSELGARTWQRELVIPVVLANW